MADPSETSSGSVSEQTRTGPLLCDGELRHAVMLRDRILRVFATEADADQPESAIITIPLTHQHKASKAAPEGQEWSGYYAFSVTNVAKNQENLDEDDDDVPRLFGAPTVADRSAWIDAITAVAERQKLRRKSARLSKMARATRIAGTGFPALKIDAEATTVVLEGSLTKRGNSRITFHRWKRRWFKLTDEGKVYYWKEQSGDVSKALGSIDLRTVAIIHPSSLTNDDTLKRFYFGIEVRNRVYELYADTEAAREVWLTGLARAMEAIKNGGTLRTDYEDAYSSAETVDTRALAAASTETASGSGVRGASAGGGGARRPSSAYSNVSAGSNPDWLLPLLEATGGPGDVVSKGHHDHVVMGLEGDVAVLEEQIVVLQTQKRDAARGHETELRALQARAQAEKEALTADHAREIEAIRARLYEVQEKNVALVMEAKDLRRERVNSSTVDQEVVELRAAVATKAREIQAAEETAAELTAELARYKSEAEAASAAAQEHKKELSRARRLARRELADKTAEMTAALAAAEEQVSVLTGRLDEATAAERDRSTSKSAAAAEALEASERKAAVLAERVVQLEERAEAAAAAAEARRTEAAELEATLGGERNDALKQVAALRAELLEAEAGRREAEARLTTSATNVQTEVSAAEATLADREQEVARLTAAVEALGVAKETELAAVEADTAKRIARLEARVEREREDRKRVEASLTERLEETAARLTADLNEQRAARRAAEAALMEAEQQARSDRTAAERESSARIRTLERDGRAAEARAAQLATEAEELRDALAVEQATVERLRAKVARATESDAALKAAEAALDRERRKAERTSDRHAADIAELEREKASAVRQARMAEDSKEALNGQLAAARDEAAAASAEVRSLRLGVQAAEDRAAAAARQVERLESDKRETAQVVADLEAKLTEVEEERQRAVRRLDRLSMASSGSRGREISKGSLSFPMSKAEGMESDDDGNASGSSGRRPARTASSLELQVKDQGQVLDVGFDLSTGDLPNLDLLVEAGNPEQRFTELSDLGLGSNGTIVLSGVDSADEGLAKAALKVIDPAEDGIDLLQVTFEIALMKSTAHPHIVNFYGAWLHNSKLWVGMEFMAGGGLDGLIDREDLTEARIAELSRDILAGLAYLHRRNIVHRDMKSDNVLLTADGRAKLADFGVACQLTEQNPTTSAVVGTPYWMAPEVIQGQPYGLAVDIWSFGIVVHEMTMRQPPYAEQPPIRALVLITTQGIPPIDASAWSAPLVAFVEAAVTPDPSERRTVDQMMALPFLAA